MLRLKEIRVSRGGSDKNAGDILKFILGITCVWVIMEYISSRTENDKMKWQLG